MKKSLLCFGIVFALTIASFSFAACKDKWEGYKLVESKSELVQAVADKDIDKIRVKSGNYGTSDAYENIVITRPLTIKGDGVKPVIFGSIVVNLAADNNGVVTIENLEISQSGQYVKDSTTQKTDFTKDGRRGVLIQNGSVVIKNNYIHLTNQAPDPKLTNGPSAIQLSVSAESTSEYQAARTYVVKDNRIGKYAKIQTTSSSEPSGLLAERNTNQAISVSRAVIDAMYEDNMFDAGSDIIYCLIDYASSKYLAGAFISEAMAKECMGETYGFLADGLTVKESGGIWKIVAKV